MSNSCATVHHYFHYHPGDVQRVIATGTSAFVGVVDDSTVLKYPLEPGGDLASLKYEHELLQIVGPHPRIVAVKEPGLTDIGLYLERGSNGTLMDYVTDNPAHSMQQRLSWCKEVTEAVAHVHSKNVIHCDVNPSNILLDNGLHVKLSDFQGCHIDDQGTVLPHAIAAEPCRYSCPRSDDVEATFKTDLFALGSTIHFIIMGQEVFPDIVYGEQGWHEEVQSRFERLMFPNEPHPCLSITRKCWLQEYSSANEVLEELVEVERRAMTE